MKGQVALELAIMLGIAVVFLMVLLLIVVQWAGPVRGEQRQEVADGMATALRQELVLAASVEDGYTRTFAVPERIDSYNYSIVQSNRTLTVLLQDGTSSTRIIPDVQGAIHKGSVTIMKRNGSITLI